jgi:hypothetical protein
MRFNVSSKTVVADAKNLIYPLIRSILNSTDFSRKVGSDLVASRYVGDSGNGNPVASQGNNNNPTQEQLNAGGLGVTSIVMVAIGSAALIVFVGAIYYWRRSHESDSSDFGGNAANCNDGSSTLLSNIPPDMHNRPTSPFTEMIPDSYGFNSNMSLISGPGMSAIAEDEEAQSDQNSDIIMSDSGFSTDAQTTDGSLLELGQSNYTRQFESPSILGARSNPMTSIQLQSEGGEYSDSELSCDEPCTPAKKISLLSSSSAPVSSPSRRDESFEADDAVLFRD